MFFLVIGPTLGETKDGRGLYSFCKMLVQRGWFAGSLGELKGSKGNVRFLSLFLSSFLG